MPCCNASCLIIPLMMTINLTLISGILALIISFVVGLSRLSRFRAARVVAILYLEFFRGTSALVQLFFMFYVLPLWGITFSPFAAGVIACGFNLGSYGSEVVRASVKSIGQPQREAALSLNYNTFQLYRYVLIPQAVPMMIPPFGNLLIELMKLTAVILFLMRTD